MEKKLEKA
jgi:hypothetical protein